MSVGGVKKVLAIDKRDKVLLLDKCDLRQLEACRRTPRVTNYVTTVYLYPVKFDFEITLLTLIKIKMWNMYTSMTPVTDAGLCINMSRKFWN